MLKPRGQKYQSLTDTIKLTDPENVQASGGFSCTSLVIADFVLKIANFRCHGNKGLSEPNVTGIVELADPENHTIKPKIATLCYMQPKLWQIFWKNSQFFVTMATGFV